MPPRTVRRRSWLAAAGGGHSYLRELLVNANVVSRSAPLTDKALKGVIDECSEITQKTNDIKIQY